MHESLHIDEWLKDLRIHCALKAPNLLSLFDTYAAEARFGRQYITADTSLLEQGAHILEIGAGALLLSCQLVREGFQVTALEPTGSGFSHFEQLRALVLERAEALSCVPRILAISAEELNEKHAYEFAFSINVMEHVSNVAGVITKVCESLVCGASYRFTCANYLFPYEPHFNIPTLFSKNITAHFFWKSIINSSGVVDPMGTWLSLNWINVVQVARVAEDISGVCATFNRQILVKTLERMPVDQHFASRRSPFVRFLISVMIRLRLHRIFGYVPASFQPIMDCRLTKLVRP